jgi:hypothetical protein
MPTLIKPRSSLGISIATCWAKTVFGFGYGRLSTLARVAVAELALALWRRS